MQVAEISDRGSIHHQESLSLAADVLRAGSSIRLKARGVSMLPTLWPGDVLSIVPLDGKPIRAGDIVLILRGSRAIVHRVRNRIESVEGPRWITRGDAVLQSDPPASKSEILGRINGVFRDNQFQTLSNRVGLATRSLAWMFRRSDLSVRLALRIRALRSRPDEDLPLYPLKGDC